MALSEADSLLLTEKVRSLKYPLQMLVKKVAGGHPDDQAGSLLGLTLAEVKDGIREISEFVGINPDESYQASRRIIAVLGKHHNRQALEADEKELLVKFLHESADTDAEEPNDVDTEETEDQGAQDERAPTKEPTSDVPRLSNPSELARHFKTLSRRDLERLRLLAGAEHGKTGELAEAFGLNPVSLPSTLVNLGKKARLPPFRGPGAFQKRKEILKEVFRILDGVKIEPLPPAPPSGSQGISNVANTSSSGVEAETPPPIFVGRRREANGSYLPEVPKIELSKMNGSAELLIVEGHFRDGEPLQELRQRIEQFAQVGLAPVAIVLRPDRELKNIFRAQVIMATRGEDNI